MALTKEDLEASRRGYRGCYTKTRFKEKRTARIKARRLGIFFYKCPRCDGYHLTKMSKQMWERRQARLEP